MPKEVDVSTFERDFLKCGNDLFGEKRFHEAIDCYKKAFSKALSWKDKFKALLWLGNCYLEISNYSDALYSYGQAEMLAIENSDTAMIDQILQIKELCHRKSGNFPAAEKIKKERRVYAKRPHLS